MIANFDITTLDYVYNNKSSNGDYTCNFVEGLLTQDNHGQARPRHGDRVELQRRCFRVDLHHS